MSNAALILPKDIKKLFLQQFPTAKHLSIQLIDDRYELKVDFVTRLTLIAHGRPKNNKEEMNVAAIVESALAGNTHHEATGYTIYVDQKLWFVRDWTSGDYQWGCNPISGHHTGGKKLKILPHCYTQSSGEKEPIRPAPQMTTLSAETVTRAREAFTRIKNF